MKPRTTGIALLFCGLLLAGSAFAQTTEPAATAAAETQATATAEATPSCSDCHENKTHKASTCESCHGDGKAHAEAGGDTSLIDKPEGLAGANKTCLTCHDVNTDRISRHGGMHANSAAVNCLTCHAIHNSEPNAPHLLSRPQSQLCSSCHATQSASLRNKPYAHRLGRGGMECSSCHEPHGRPGRENLRKTAAGESPCLSCHSEKRGPYVFEHGALATRDCTNCHETHGSSNPKQLKRATVAQLCLECHSPIGTNAAGSQPPSFHNLSLPRYQNCTTCHVAIHGSHRDPQLLK